MPVNAVNPVKPLIDGILTGCLSTVIFNPVDQTLFLMVKEKKPFFDPSLWKTPYRGVTKALYGRIMSYGVYLAFFDLYSDFFKKRTKQHLVLASLATGTSTVVCSHGFNVVKMYQWSHNSSGGMLQSTKLMTKEYGGRVFLTAFPQTCARDCLFSLGYFILSKKLNEKKKFGVSVLIASSSTALLSPLNYLRSRAFFDFKEPHVPVRRVAQELKEGMQAKKTLFQKVAFIAHSRFNIGFGTLRVGVGMAVADKIYHYLRGCSYIEKWLL
jgi:hypothetical protein